MGRTFKNSKLTLPIKKIKTFDDDGNGSYVTPQTETATVTPEQPQIHPVEHHAQTHAVNDFEPDMTYDTEVEKYADQVVDDQDHIGVIVNSLVESKDQPSVPALNEVAEVDDVAQEKTLAFSNDDIKQFYKSHVKVLNWSLSCNHATATVNLPLSVKGNSTRKTLETSDKHASKHGVKRKLFQSEDNQDIASGRKKTTLDLARQLLGQSQVVAECIKYKELMQKHPSHGSFSSLYHQWYSKLQIQVGKKYHHLKDQIESLEINEDKASLQADKGLAQHLLDKWGMYYTS